MEKLLSLFLNATGVSTDTRKIEKGNIFFALKGPTFNGNKFAEQALSKGAAIAIVDDQNLKDKDDHLLVEDTLTTLQQLAKEYRQYLNCDVFAITGSNGKTTTKELIYNVLKSKKCVWATPGNFNNHIGVPLTILSAPKNTEIMIIEMGDNKPGDINELCEIALPNSGYITNVGKDHLQGYNNSMDLNIATKNELNIYLKKTGGLCFYSIKDELTSGLAKQVFNRKCVEDYLKNWNITSLTSNPFVTIQVKEKEVKSNLVGDYNHQNINVAIGIGAYYDVPLKEILNSIEEYQPKNNRSELMQTDHNILVMDAYNSNPSSLETALGSFLILPSEHDKGVILGDMLELGSIENEEHYQVLNKISKENLKHRYFVGALFSQFKNQFPNLLFFSTTAELQNFLRENPIKKAFLLLKGSRGIKLENLKEVL